MESYNKYNKIKTSKSDTCLYYTPHVIKSGKIDIPIYQTHVIISQSYLDCTYMQNWICMYVSG